MKRDHWLFAIFTVIILMLACNATPTPLPNTPTPSIAKPTLAPPIGPTAPPVAKPTQPPPQPGSISGKLCYPSSYIPPMTIYAVDQQANKWFKTQSKGPADASYSLDNIAPGTYLVYAWLDEGQMGGSYSQAVPCGLDVKCTDHSLIPVVVQPGQQVTNIDVCDWYGPIPPPPPE